MTRAICGDPHVMPIFMYRHQIRIFLLSYIAAYVKVIFV